MRDRQGGASVAAGGRRPRAEGYTLVELVVVCLIVGVIAAIGVPQYLKTVESSKADDAVTLLNQIATANKMFALDHSNYYAAAKLAAACGSGACPATAAAVQTNACVLVWCGYLVDQNWASKPYAFYACDGNSAGACAGLGSSNFTAGAARNGGTSPYSSWGYTVAVAGTITPYNGAPAPTY